VIELRAGQKQKLDSIREKYGIRFVLAFGSRIGGIVHQESDLDSRVLYEGEQKPLDVAADLQEVFPRYEVDLVNLNHADPLLLNEVNKGNLTYRITSRISRTMYWRNGFSKESLAG
jgi:predicted nucleotidyltransferase